MEKRRISWSFKVRWPSHAEFIGAIFATLIIGILVGREWFPMGAQKPAPVTVTVASRIALCDSVMQSLKTKMSRPLKTKEDTLALNDANAQYVWWTGAKAMYENLAVEKIEVKQ